MQHEVIQALYTDPEIARTMSAYINGTLAGGVFSVRGLLEPPPAESQQGDDSNDGRLQASDDGRFPLDKLLDDIGAHIANVGRKLGDVVKSLGDALSRWVDGLLKPYGPAGKSAAGGGAQRQQQPGQPPIADGGRVLSVALTIAALLVVMLLVRKPIVVRRNKHGPAFA